MRTCRLWVVAGMVLSTGCAASSTPAATATSAAASPPPVAAVSSPSPAAPAASASPAAAPVCPPAYAAPDPKRPRLTADVSVSGGTVTGTEQVVFTPDLPVTEIVFRLWGAAPRPTHAGGRVSIGRTVVDGRPVAARRTAPTVLRVPAVVPAGRPVTVEVSFTLRLPTGVNDRFGHRGTTAWFGSGLPLLAWERGRGWALEPATSAFAEASTSEEMRLTSLTVHRAEGLGVLATGRQVSDDGTTAVFQAPAVRDVAVAVGAFRPASDRAAGLDVGVAPGVPDDPGSVLTAVERAMRTHSDRFGPFPYEHLAVAVLPDLHGGIEYPGAVLMGTGQTRDATASHEVAHQWFYGLVGDDQARDPWLDESFATYAEALDRGTAPRYEQVVIPVGGRGRTGMPMTFWESRQSLYFRSVYLQGAAALLRARRAVGPARFDSAVRCYVRRNAHRIATPDDLRQALTSLPAAVQELRTAGALR